MTEPIKRYTIECDGYCDTLLLSDGTPTDRQNGFNPERVYYGEELILATDHDAALAKERARSNDYHTKAMNCADQRDRNALERDHLREKLRSGLSNLRICHGHLVDDFEEGPCVICENLELRARVAELEAEIYDANKGDRS